MLFCFTLVRVSWVSGVGCLIALDFHGVPQLLVCL